MLTIVMLWKNKPEFVRRRKWPGFRLRLNVTSVDPLQIVERRLMCGRADRCRNQWRRPAVGSGASQKEHVMRINSSSSRLCSGTVDRSAADSRAIAPQNGILKRDYTSNKADFMQIFTCKGHRYLINGLPCNEAGVCNLIQTVQ